jgi:hypothetical protein
MQHVAEGVLHAYLDGALDEYPASEAEHAREHLEVCEACRDRLEAERVIRDRAAAILGVGKPEVGFPNLEELRAHARARAPRRGPASGRLYRLGWAASIVLALGAGWALRGGRLAPVDVSSGIATVDGTGVSDGASPEAADASGSVAPAANGSSPGGGPETGTALADATESTAEPGRLLPSRTGPVTVPVDVVALDEQVVSGSAARVRPELDLGAPPLLQAPPLDVPDLAGGVQVADAVVPASEPARDEPTSDGGDPETRRAQVPSPGQVMTSASRAGDGSVISPFGRTSQGGDDVREERVDDGESYSLVVPDMEVLDVRFRGGVRPEGQVVLQRLASGDTLEVIHLPPEIEPSTLREAGPSDRQIVLETASGWIVMRAPVSEDQLRGLMRRLLSAD